MFTGYSGQEVTIDMLTGATADIARNKGVEPEEVSANDLIEKIKQTPPAYIGDQFYTVRGLLYTLRKVLIGPLLVASVLGCIIGIQTQEDINFISKIASRI
jgi:hypothetical protein